jgi:hypothetical protein
VLELFIYKSEVNNCFGKWLFLSTNGNRVIVIFHTKQVESGSEILLFDIYNVHMHFYII